MVIKAKKVCISLPQESLTQLEWLRRNVLHAPESASFSGLIQMAIGLAYFAYLQNENYLFCIQQNK